MVTQIKYIYQQSTNIQKLNHWRICRIHKSEIVYEDFIRIYIESLKSNGFKYELPDEFKNNVWQIILWFCNDDRFNGNLKKGLFLRGEKGTGKTMICETLVKVIIKGDKKHCKIINARDLQTAYSDENTDLISSLKERFLTIIDDLGIEQNEIKNYGTIIEPFNDLFDYRYRNRLETIITTNQTPIWIKETYGDRIIDRFKECFNEIVFNYKSFRK